jgi:hypothetical protein
MTQKPAFCIFTPGSEVASMQSVVASGKVSKAEYDIADKLAGFVDPDKVTMRAYQNNARSAMVPIFNFVRPAGYEIVAFVTDLVCDNAEALCQAVAQMPRDTFLVIVPVCEDTYDEGLARRLDNLSPVGSRVAVYVPGDKTSATVNHDELIAWAQEHNLPVPA